MRFYNCLITRWLETTSVLVVIERIYSYQFKSNYLKNHRLFAAFFLHFWYIYGIYNVLQKKMSVIVKYFWSYWLWKMCLFKCITGRFSENHLAGNVLTSCKNSIKVKKSTFSLLFHQSEENWVWKSYFQ